MPRLAEHESSLPFIFMMFIPTIMSDTKPQLSLRLLSPVHFRDRSPETLSESLFTIDGNLGNVSAGVSISIIAYQDYQCKRGGKLIVV